MTRQPVGSVGGVGDSDWRWVSHPTATGCDEGGSLLPTASSWAVGSSSFHLAAWGSASSAFLSPGEALPQEMVENEGCEPRSLSKGAGCSRERLRSWQERPEKEGGQG